MDSSNPTIAAAATFPTCPEWCELPVNQHRPERVHDESGALIVAVDHVGPTWFGNRGSRNEISAHVVGEEISSRPGHSPAVVMLALEENEHTHDELLEVIAAVTAAAAWLREHAPDAASA